MAKRPRKRKGRKTPASSRKTRKKKGRAASAASPAKKKKRTASKTAAKTRQRRQASATSPRKRQGRTAGAHIQQMAIVLEHEPLHVVATRTPPPTEPSHHFRILRPRDLVVLDVIGWDLEHGLEDELLVLRPAGPQPRLEVRYTFQHLLEAAEPEQENPPPPMGVPIQSRAAWGSRLVFDVPEAERIEYSVAGVLAAISRLPLRVAPLATPRALPQRFARPQLGNLVVAATLPGGIQLYRTDAGLVLAPPQTGETPQLGGSRALIAAAAGLRTARQLLSNERGINLSGIDLGAGKGGFDRVIRVPGLLQRLRQRPRAPREDETAIEAPFRVILSPSTHGGFTHAVEPQAVAPDPDRSDDPERVELWHSRLGVRRVDGDDVTIDEVDDPQKAVRAIWARDMDSPAPDVIPFLASLVQSDREALVRQSADPAIAPPQPVAADRLYLTALGAWLELHGRWDVEPYTTAGLESIVAWDHEATVGRDNFVRVVKPYYLFPFGHRCQLITITERKIKETKNPQARLFQRKFIAVQQPVRTFEDRSMPFLQVRLRPLITPNLDFRDPPPFPPDVAGSVDDTVYGDDLFWPTVGGSKYRFVLDCLDRNGRRVVVRAALLAVGAHLGNATHKNDIRNAYTGDIDRPIAGDGQMVAMATSTTPGDTAYETVELRFTGDPGNPGTQTSTPHLEESDIVVPAMRHLAPSSNQVTVKYAPTYLSNGFSGVNADPQVLLELTAMTQISFGSGTDDSGGFIQPDLPVRGLSRKIGVVGDIDSVVNPPNPAEAFNPTEFLSGVLPKLFGLFELTDILALAGLDKAPSFITDQLDKIAGLLADLEDLAGAVQRGVDRLADDAANAPTTALRDQAEAARAALDAIRTSYATRVQNLQDAVDNLLALDTPSDLPAVTAAVSDILDDLAGFVTDLQSIARTLPLPPTAKAELERLTGALEPLLAAAQIAGTIEAIADFVNGLDPSGGAVRARFEWRPTLSNFPASAANEDDALFFVDPNGFVLSVEARASGGSGVGADVLAELSDFGLNLFPGEPLIKIRFDRLAFRASSGRKPEVDVVFTGIEWQGILGFIETLQELIPFDGFSDPPYVDVSTEGITAGFDLGLPAISVGVFSLENISLGADVQVPFLGDAVTVGFNFCTREKPFRLTVMMIGGGGFVGIRLSPKGLVVLEMALEAGASLSIDLGVASGSVSIMVGIYMKLEADAGSLTGYFRIRGEVDVLGLITASITLELSLTYEFATGKMVGRASITIEIEVFIFSGSVEVSCERRLAGSNGDPTLAQILGVPEDGTPLTTVPAAWSDYCVAFAGA